MLMRLPRFQNTLLFEGAREKFRAPFLCRDTAKKTYGHFFMRCSVKFLQKKPFIVLRTAYAPAEAGCKMKTNPAGSPGSLPGEAKKRTKKARAARRGMQLSLLSYQNMR